MVKSSSFKLAYLYDKCLKSFHIYISQKLGDFWAQRLHIRSHQRPCCRVAGTARNAPKLQPSLTGLISSLLPYLLPLQLVSDSIIYLLLWYSLGLARSANGYTTRWLTSVFIAFSKSLADFWKKLSLILFLRRISASFYRFLSARFAKIGSFAPPRQIWCFEVHQNSHYSPSGGTT